MSVQTCVGCSTRYADGLEACPHCGSTEREQDGAVISRRLPLLVAVSCDCGCGPWQLRLSMVLTGLVQVPELHCASCGSRVHIPWPPAEDDMPKITVHGGASNAREADHSPDASASQPLVGAEADQGRPTPAPEPEVSAAELLAVVAEHLSEGEADTPEDTPDPYAGMTLSELRAAADERGIPSYGTKSQIAERLREADAS